MDPIKILSSMALTILAILLVLPQPILTNNEDAFIRLYTDSGSVLEIEDQGLIRPNAVAVMAKREQRAVKQRFCGDFLVQALALVCKGNYRKRGDEGDFGALLELSDNTKERVNFEPESMVNDNQRYRWSDMFEILKNANSPYKNAKTAPSGNANSAELTKSKSLRQSKRGVVDECCRKPCSTAILSQYCSIA